MPLSSMPVFTFGSKPGISFRLYVWLELVDENARTNARRKEIVIMFFFIWERFYIVTAKIKTFGANNEYANDEYVNENFAILYFTMVGKRMF